MKIINNILLIISFNTFCAERIVYHPQELLRIRDNMRAQGQLAAAPAAVNILMQINQQRQTKKSKRCIKFNSSRTK